MNAASKLQLVSASIAGLKALSNDDKEKSLDAIFGMLREVIADPDASKEDRERARRMLKAANEPETDDDNGGDDKGEKKDAKMSASERFIAARMGGQIQASGPRNVGRSLELGPMSAAQAEKRLKELEGGR